MADRKKLLATSHPAFRFLVEVDKEPYGVFTECTLPNVEWETEEVKEGGLNTYTHQLPGRRKQARITLRNGVGRSPFVDWYLKIMQETIERRAVAITLLDMKQKAVMVWQISDAYPIKWQGPQLKTGENSIAVQTLELACGDVNLEPG